MEASSKSASAISFGCSVNVLALTTSTCKPPLKLHMLHTNNHYNIHFLNTWHHIFAYVQASANNLTDSDLIGFQELLEEQSSQYIAELGALRNIFTDQDDEKIMLYTDTLRTAESIWLLAHVMFVLPHTSIVRQLITWFHFHLSGSHSEQKSEAELQRIDYFDMNELFWTTLHQRILRGQLVDAIQLIDSIEDMSLEAICEEAKILLQSVPCLSTNHTVSSSEFDETQQSFHELAKKFISMLTEPEHEMFKVMALICLGDATTLKSMCTSWLDLFISVLLYRNPSCGKTDLRDTLAECIACADKQYPHDESLKEPYFECVCRILQMNVPSAMLSCREAIPEVPFVCAHLTDLIYHAYPNCQSLLVQPLVGRDQMSLRTRLLLEYALSIIDDGELWQLAPDYLVCAGAHGTQILHEVLPRMAYSHASTSSDEWQTRKVLSTCVNYGLFDTAKIIARFLSKRAFTLGNLGSALTWAVKARDDEAVNMIGHNFVKQFVSASPQTSTDFSELLDLFGSVSEVPNSLRSLDAFCRSQLLSSIDERIAAIIELIDDKSCPPELISHAMRLTINELIEVGEDVFISTSCLYSLQAIFLRHSLTDASVFSTDTRRILLKHVARSLTAV